MPSVSTTASAPCRRSSMRSSLGTPLADVAGWLIRQGTRWQQTPWPDTDFSLDEVPLPARHLVAGWRHRYACLHHRPTLPDRDRARLSVSLLVLFGMAAVRSHRSRAVDRERLRRLRDDRGSDLHRRRSVLAPPVPQPGARRSAQGTRAAKGLDPRPVARRHRRPASRAARRLAPDRPRVRHLLRSRGCDQRGPPEPDQGHDRRSHRRGTGGRPRARYGVTGNFVIDPDWAEADFERLWAFVDRHKLGRAGFTILTPLPGTAYYDASRDRIRAVRWSQFDMHHLLWEPRLGVQRFFELYCETWRRSVLNLKGEKKLWHWLAHAKPRHWCAPAAGAPAHAADDAAVALRAGSRAAAAGRRRSRTGRLIDESGLTSEDGEGAFVNRQVRADVPELDRLAVAVRIVHRHLDHQQARADRPRSAGVRGPRRSACASASGRAGRRCERSDRMTASIVNISRSCWARRP